MMTENIIIEKTVEFVKESLSHAEGGHDWWHILRVLNTSLKIAEGEKANIFIVQLGALLHDIADSKFHEGDEELGPQKAEDFLRSLQVKEDIILHVKNIIANISFKGGKEKQKFHSLELEIIQDADRLDAIGAIGIARAFNYGGYKGRELYNPHCKPDMNLSKEAYKAAKAPTLNHFYEKLLLLKDLMNTRKGKEMAKQRHDFMLLYLEQFYEEWGSEDIKKEAN